MLLHLPTKINQQNKNVCMTLYSVKFQIGNFIMNSESHIELRWYYSEISLLLWFNYNFETLQHGNISTCELFRWKWILHKMAIFQKKNTNKNKKIESAVDKKVFITINVHRYCDFMLSVCILRSLFTWFEHVVHKLNLSILMNKIKAC